jgi:dTDP-4-dehydrorhamnose 3,5-epimerase
MKCTATELQGLCLVEPRVFRDERGRFLETWNERRYAEIGITSSFVQDNASVSSRGVLRGLHSQRAHPQGKLVSVLEGEVFDVAVDLREGSATYGRWRGFTLSAENGHQLYVPEGFAHGFLTLSERAIFVYKCTNYYDPESEITVLWNDPALAIGWPIRDPVLSEKDRAGRLLRDVAPVPTT